MKALIRSGSSTLAMNLLGTGATVGTAMLLTRMLSTADYGIYVFTMSIVAILVTVGQLGGQNLAVKCVAEFISRGELRILRGFLRYTFTLNSACAMVLGALLLGFAHYFPEVTKGRFVSIAVALLPLYTISAIVAGIIRGTDNPGLGILHEVVLRPVFLGVALLIASKKWASFEPNDAVMLNIIATAWALCVGVAIMYARLRRFAVKDVPEYNRQQWFRESMPLFGVSLVGALIENIPAWILISLSTPTDVALFKVASQGGTFISFILLSLNSAAMPKISAAYAKKNFAEIEQISQSTVKIGLMFTLPLLLAFSLFPSEIIGLLFGARYTQASTALVVYSIGRYCMILLGIPGAVLMMTGRAEVVMRGWIFSAAVSTVVALFLTPLLGYVGMAVSLVIGEFGLNIFLMRRVKAIHGVSTHLTIGPARALGV